jgi:hypothetical protein
VDHGGQSTVMGLRFSDIGTKCAHGQTPQYCLAVIQGGI